MVGLILTLAGLVWAVIRGDRAWWLVSVGLGLFYLVLETLPLKPPPFAARYMVAVLPYASLLGGGVLAFAWESRPPLKALVGLLCAATIGINGFQSVRQVWAMRPDKPSPRRSVVPV